MSPPVERRGALALIGCGAIAESFYLPALVRRPKAAERVILVDRDGERLETLCRRFGLRRASTDYREVLPQAETAILATPPELHHRMALDCFAAGVHVLCEKPLAAAPAEAREMVEAAARAKLVLAVNQSRRLFPTSQFVQRALAGGKLGRLRGIRYLEGQPFAWPTATGFYFKAGPAPRGVLLDRGAHVLDLLCWWLGGRPRVVRSQNDAFGGPEAVSHLELEHAGCRIEIRLSWLTQQPNRFWIVGEEGEIEGEIYEWRRLDLRPAGHPVESLRFPSPAGVFNDFAPVLLDDFLAASRGEAEVMVLGAAVVDSLELLEGCYDAATRFELPWNEHVAEMLDG